MACNYKLDLLAYTSVTLMIGLGVFFSFLLGAAVANGGRVTLDMTMFNEMWIEYAMLMLVTGTAPWGWWYITVYNDDTVPS